ncbi:hypothetical protein Acidovoranil_01560 [Acidovorax sp. FG27]
MEWSRSSRARGGGSPLAAGTAGAEGPEAAARPWAAAEGAAEGPPGSLCAAAMEGSGTLAGMKGGMGSEEGNTDESKYETVR